VTEADSDSRVGMKLLPSLPDPAICRAKLIVHPDLVDCLVPNARLCPNAMNYGGAYFCNHPDKLEIVKATEAEKQKTPGQSGGATP
jgi:hypothetical protein